MRSIRAIDGRYLGHPFFLFIGKERPWQRLSSASKFIELVLEDRRRLDFPSLITNFNTGTAVSGRGLDFRFLFVQL